MTSLLAHEKDNVALNVHAARARVERETGKSVQAQRIEQFRLARGIGLLNPQEYYAYRLYDDAHYSRSDRQRFLGFAAQKRILLGINDRTWQALAGDKIAFTGLMQSHGVAVPRILGVFQPFRSVPSAATLPSENRLRAFLRGSANYPLFCKPNHSSGSIATARLENYDAAGDEVIAYDGARYRLDAFIADITRYIKKGYLFQEVMHPHERIAAVCGDRIATARIMTILGDAGPELFQTIWKIPTGSNAADNFWRRGNLVAAVDTGTGRVTRAVTGMGPDQREVQRHPDTDAVIQDFVIPDWDRVKQLVLAASTTMPGIRMQAWDVAICRDGPALLEVNISGSFMLPQTATGRGILDQRFRRLLAESGYVHHVPLVSLRLEDTVRNKTKSVWRMLSRSRVPSANSR